MRKSLDHVVVLVPVQSECPTAGEPGHRSTTDRVVADAARHRDSHRDPDPLQQSVLRTLVSGSEEQHDDQRAESDEASGGHQSAEASGGGQVHRSPRRGDSGARLAGCLQRFGGAGIVVRAESSTLTGGPASPPAQPPGAMVVVEVGGPS